MDNLVPPLVGHLVRHQHFQLTLIASIVINADETDLGVFHAAEVKRGRRYTQIAIGVSAKVIAIDAQRGNRIVERRAAHRLLAG